MDARMIVSGRRAVRRGLRLALLLGSVAALLATGNTFAQGPASLPDAPGQVMLIRNTVAAINHGNITGNYTVLRDLSSDGFRRQNTAAQLAATFANLRQQKLDLSPVLVIDPQLTQQPGTDQQGRFHLVGFFPTRPQAVQFVLVFQPASGGWMIDEISIGVKPIESIVQVQHGPPQSTPPSAGPSDRRVGHWPSDAPQRAVSR